MEKDIDQFAHYYTPESNQKLTQSSSNSSLHSLRKDSLKRNNSVQEFIQIVANWSIKEDENDLNIQWIPFEPAQEFTLTVRNPDLNNLRIDTKCTFFIDDSEELSIDEMYESIATATASPREGTEFQLDALTFGSTPTLHQPEDNVSRSDSKMGMYSKTRSKSVDYTAYLPPSPRLGYLSMFRRDERIDPCHLAYRNYQRMYRDRPLNRVQTFIRSRSSIDVHIQHKKRDSSPVDLDHSQALVPKPSRLERVKSTLSLTSNLNLSKITLFRRGSKLNTALF
jgi:hypothetical protein